MPLPLYLAMTAAEISKNMALPVHLAYMACHFSPYSTGLSNLPDSLPPGSMLILNDRIPVHGHDPERIAGQLVSFVEEKQVSALLLDFERPPSPLCQAIVDTICSALQCPVGVKPDYGADPDRAVFLSIAPHEAPLKAIHKWQGRRIWLEAAVERSYVQIGSDGAQLLPPPDREMCLPFYDEALFAHYRTDVTKHHAGFTIHRTPQDVFQLLENCHADLAVGLWQQLKE